MRRQETVSQQTENKESNSERIEVVRESETIEDISLKEVEQLFVSQERFMDKIHVLSSQAERAGVSGDDLESVHTEAAAITQEIEGGTKDLLREFIEVSPDTLKKRVQEASDFLAKDPGLSAKDLAEEFALDERTAELYASMARAFGAQPEEAPKNPEEQPAAQSAEQGYAGTHEESPRVEEAPATRVESKPQTEERAADTYEEEEEEEEDWEAEIRRAEIFGEAELRHLDRTAEDVGDIRLEKMLRNRVDRMVSGFNVFLKRDEVRDLAQGLFGDDFEPKQLNAAKIRRSVGVFSRKAGGVFSFVKKMIGFDQPIKRSIKKIQRMPRAVGYKVREAIDDGLSHAAGMFERPLSKFRAKRADNQMHAALRQIEGGYSNDPDRVRKFAQKARWAQEYMNRVHGDAE